MLEIVGAISMKDQKHRKTNIFVALCIYASILQDEENSDQNSEEDYAIEEIEVSVDCPKTWLGKL